MLNGLDLFSGTGGISFALSPWVTPVAYCENDRYAQAVLLSRMQKGDIASAPIWDDVQTLEASRLPSGMWPEIIYGGFPCQDISCAGNGAGLEGERSGLFFEVLRLVSEIRPRFVFLENSSNIRTKGAHVIAGRMADAGYDCRWITLSADEVGAIQERNRWWFLAANIDGVGKLQPERRIQNIGGWIGNRFEKIGTLTASNRIRSEKFRKGRVPTPSEIAGGPLNPTWAEWFMGYPMGWTELSAWATQWFRSVRGKLSSASCSEPTN